MVTSDGSRPAASAPLPPGVTHNRTRPVAEFRSTLTRNGGTMAEAGSVSWNFDSKGVILIESCGDKVEEVALLAIDAGAEDVKIEDSSLEVFTRPEDLEPVKAALEEQVSIESADLAMVPKNIIELDAKAAIHTLKLMDKLEALDDIQRVFSNADFPPEALKAYQEES